MPEIILPWHLWINLGWKSKLALGLAAVAWFVGAVLLLAEIIEWVS